ncbi:MAG TPA: DUF3618 domain-containing protein [Gemmatimonadaceae bacterium]
MAETTADVRRDIELTRERMSDTLAQLEQKMNLMQIVRDHPWPALAVAVAAGALLAGSGSDVKAAGATVAATKGASSKIGTLLDDAVSSLVTGAHDAFQGRLEGWVNELKTAIGAPTNTRSGDGASRSSANLGGAGGAGYASSGVANVGLGGTSGGRSFDATGPAATGTMGAADASQAMRAD